MLSAQPPDGRSALLTDLYQLTMLQGYFDHGMTDVAVFEFFVRRLPSRRNFLIAAGLQQALEYLETLRFTPVDLAFLEETGLFDSKFLSYLEEMRFAGDVDAMPEGTLAFGDEPILRITAPLPQAQLVESRIVNILHFQTLIASKAARCVLAMPDVPLIDFGMRRAHGSEAALTAARASYLAGFAGTATVLAKAEFDIPIFGTMAHSFVQAHDSEAAAFEHFVASYRGKAVLLIDTYDTETGARRVVELARRLPPGTIRSVRLDSGDLAALARSVRRILDDGGFEDIQIFASGGIDELELARCAASEAPIDGFGIGTNLDVSGDCPSLDCVYKLQEYAGKPRRKRSTGKATWPGRKQVFRSYDRDGRLKEDILTVLDDDPPGDPLLQPVMRAGARTRALPNLDSIRRQVRSELTRLTPDLRSLIDHTEYPVRVAPALKRLADEVDREFL